MTGRLFELAELRRHPDVEAANLYAVDATDRLLLDTAAEALTADSTGLVIIGDHYGALTLGAATRFGAQAIRTHQDLLTGERALAGNAAAFELTGCYRSLPLARALVDGARVVLVQAPKSLLELTEIVQLVAEHAAPEVQVHVGGRIKYLTPAMNDVLLRCFGRVRAGLARQKSRVISAQEPTAEGARTAFPLREWHPAEQLWVCAHGGAFAGTSIDVGTRRLVGLMAQLPDGEQAIDLGCGTGVLATLLARQGRQVIASDQSAAACVSTAATAAANDVELSIDRDDALAAQAAASADLILCNPPFHLGAAVHAGAAGTLFAGAARALRPGAQLWTVFNNHLGYRAQLTRLIGPTRLVHRDAKFSVTASTKAAQAGS